MTVMVGQRPNPEEIDRGLRVLSSTCCRRLLFELYEKMETGEGDSVDYSDTTLCLTSESRLLLHHVHLPKLEEYGYIKWNKTEETVQKGPQWKEVEPFLNLIYSHLHELPQDLQGGPSGRNGMES